MPQLPHLEALAELGRGGRCVVYRARDDEGGAWAVKMPVVPDVPSREATAKTNGELRREAALLA